MELSKTEFAKEQNSSSVKEETNQKLTEQVKQIEKYLY